MVELPHYTDQFYSPTRSDGTHLPDLVDPRFRTTHRSRPPASPRMGAAVFAERPTRTGLRSPYNADRARANTMASTRNGRSHLVVYRCYGIRGIR